MPFQYTFRADDISTWDADTRDLLENRDRELELYSTTIDTSFLNLNATNLTSGTVPSARMTGAYTGITGLGTLTGLAVAATTGTAVSITNTGTGNSFLVEDSASPDSSPFVIDAAGNVGIGTTAPSAVLDVIGGITTRGTSTSDGIQLVGNGTGSSSRVVSLIPTALTTNRTLTLPNVDGTAITTGNLSSITSVGTLSSLSINGPNAGSPVVTIGDWNQDDRYTAFRSQYGYLLLGSTSVPNANIYLRTETASGTVIIGGGANNNVMTVGTSSAVIAGTMPSITVGAWSSSNVFSTVETSKGYLLLGATSGNDNVYLRSKGATVVYIGGNESNTLTVGNSDSTFAGTLNGNNTWNNTADTKASNLWITSYLIANTGVTSAGQAAQWITAFGLWYLVRNSSTRTEKENIQPLNGIVTANMIDDINVLLWNRKNAAGVPEIGPMAEDMDEISPFLSTRGIDYDADGKVVQTEPNGINTNSWMSLMTIAIQDIRKRLEQLETV